MSSRVLPSWASTSGRVLRWVLGALLILFVLAAAWIGVRGALAYGHLTDARAAATDLPLDEPERLGAALDDIAADTQAARDLTGDPIWAAAEHLPWAGPQLAAVATVIREVDTVVGDAGGPLAEAAAGLSLDSLKPVDGRIDTAVLAGLAEPARASADATAAAHDAVLDIDRTPLVGAVRTAVGEVADLLGRTRTATDALARASAVLPGMLGADGARSHLVLVQNNAEWRTQGGIVGAASVVRTADGRLTLGEQLSSGDFDSSAVPIVDLGEYGPIYDQKPARFIQNVTQVPDFTLTAEIARSFAQLEGVAVDGVISLDPVALSYLLEATGPVRMPTGHELTSDNVVKLLLSDVYAMFDDPSDQDDFFALATAGVFGALTQGDVDPAALVGALARAGDERRLYVWSDVEAEQSVLAGTTLAGIPPRSDDDTARLLVALNDGTGSKMSWYGRPDLSLTWDTCARGIAARSLTVELTVANDAPADAATSLPDYVLGLMHDDLDPGDMRLVGEVYLPAGWDLVASSSDHGRGFGGGSVDGRQVLTWSADLAPGETVTVRATVRAVTAVRDAEAWLTPTADADLATTVRASCSAG